MTRGMCLKRVFYNSTAIVCSNLMQQTMHIYYGGLGVGVGVGLGVGVQRAEQNETWTSLHNHNHALKT